MRIGVVSDTHNHLSNTARFVELFNATRVDRVVVVHDPEDLAPDLLAGCDCAGHMPGRNSVGVLDLTTLHAQILNF